MITKLRQEGYSYKEIADSLRISLNTVKSYCRRNGLTGTYERKRTICINCGCEMEDNKRFCSSKCRQNWWNNNLDKVHRKAYYSFICKYCHEPFKTRVGNTAPTSAISRIGFTMNNELNFYTSYLLFLRLKNEGIITSIEFNKITKKLMEKYDAKIFPFMLNIA